jgi:hypothetical protein
MESRQPKNTGIKPMLLYPVSFIAPFQAAEPAQRNGSTAA